MRDLSLSKDDLRLLANTIADSDNPNFLSNDPASLSNLWQAINNSQIAYLTLPQTLPIEQWQELYAAVQNNQNLHTIEGLPPEQVELAALLEKNSKLLHNRRRIYIFDRDDTLLDKQNALINKPNILEIIQKIDERPTYTWAIASAGGSELYFDPAYQAIKERIELKKTPHYVQFSRGILGLMNRVQTIQLNETQSLTGENARNALNAAMNGKLSDFEDETKPDFSAELEQAKINFVFNRHATATFKIGETIITLKVTQLLKNQDLLDKGDYKLFFIFAALDQAKLKLNLANCPKLKKFGVTNVTAPEDFNPIDSNDVIFCDDKPGCVELARASEFTAIHADTKTNTYLNQLEEQLPPSLFEMGFRKQIAALTCLKVDQNRNETCQENQKLKIELGQRLEAKANEFFSKPSKERSDVGLNQFTRECIIELKKTDRALHNDQEWKAFLANLLLLLSVVGTVFAAVSFYSRITTGRYGLFNTKPYVPEIEDACYTLAQV